jgi:membrane protein implicated in regulation of membrane protease activity
MLIQVVVFGIVSLVLVILSRTIFKNILMRTSPGADLRTNADALIGKRGLVTEEINSLSGTGRVTIEGQDWLARAESAESLPVGTAVEVARYEGARLFVRRIEAA